MKVALSKSFIKGYGSVLNFNSTKEWPDISRDSQRDYEALRSDWYNVGRTIRRETRNFESSRTKN